MQKSFMITTDGLNEKTVTINISQVKPPEPDDALSIVSTDFELGKVTPGKISTEEHFGFAIPIQLDMNLAYASNTSLIQEDQDELRNQGINKLDIAINYEARVVYAGYLKAVCYTDGNMIVNVEQMFDEVHFVSTIDDELIALNNVGSVILHLSQDAYQDDMDIFKQSILNYSKKLSQTQIPIDVSIF